MELHEVMNIMDLFSSSSSLFSDTDDYFIIKKPKLTHGQNELLQFVEENHMSILYKRRQEGISTALMIYLLWKALSTHNYKIGIFYASSAEREIFRQMINMNLTTIETLFFEKLGIKDSVLKPQNHNGNFTKFCNGSIIHYWNKNSPDAGRGSRIDLAYISEWQNGRDCTNLLHAIIPCLCMSNSRLIITSTDVRNIKEEFFRNDEKIQEFYCNGFFDGRKFVLFEKTKNKLKSVNFKF